MMDVLYLIGALILSVLGILADRSPGRVRMAMWDTPGREIELSAAVFRLQKELPGWWWSVGSCHVSADARIGPDSAGQDAWLLKFKEFDEGIELNLRHPVTVAEVLYALIEKAKKAKAAYRRLQWTCCT